jgi:hypothetical protein
MIDDCDEPQAGAQESVGCAGGFAPMVKDEDLETLKGRSGSAAEHLGDYPYVF